MPLLHLRLCEHPCNRVRFAPCSKSCALPIDTDPANWRVNLQDGAGTIGRPASGITVYDRNYQPLDVDLSNGTLQSAP